LNEHSDKRAENARRTLWGTKKETGTDLGEREVEKIQTGKKDDHRKKDRTKSEGKGKQCGKRSDRIVGAKIQRTWGACKEKEQKTKKRNGEKRPLYDKDGPDLTQNSGGEKSG